MWVLKFEEVKIMGKADIREPSQKRSIEKKNKIIESGFELICRKGFYNTNTAEIAKRAGVSTGIVYQYFKDKRDIFMQGIDQYAKNLMFPINQIAYKKIDKKNIYSEIKSVINELIRFHKFTRSSHEEIQVIQHSDAEVDKIFQKYELEASENLANALISNGFSSENIQEKSHLILAMIDDFCHEIAYHHHNNLNYDIMMDLVIKNIIYLLEA